MRMWIFLIELIAYEKDSPEVPIMALAIGNSPQESTKSMLDENLFGPENQIADTDSNEDEDEFGFQDYDDDYADDDYDDEDYAAGGGRWRRHDDGDGGQ
jgi:hypothetical protein